MSFNSKIRLLTICQNIELYLSVIFQPQTQSLEEAAPNSSQNSQAQPSDFSGSVSPEAVSDGKHVAIRYSISDPVDSSAFPWSLRDRYDPERIGNALRSSSPFRCQQNTVAVLEQIGQNINMSFVEKLTDFIRKKGMRSASVYKAAQIDRKLFSKIISDKDYKPAKDTCIALLLALRLDLGEANDMLSRAGYTLSHSCRRDVILEYFFRAQIYNLNDINEVLHWLNEKTL